MADAADLKSAGLVLREGSNPSRPTIDSELGIVTPLYSVSPNRKDGKTWKENTLWIYESPSLS